MIPGEEPKGASEPSQTAPPKGLRRSRRGGRRHPRRRDPRSPAPPSAGKAGASDTFEPSRSAEPATPVAEAEPDRRRGFESAPRTASVSAAIEQVTGIIEELKHALNEMEEVLETLELAERQKIDDEREIEALQRALRQLHRPSQSSSQPRR